jgi:Polyketide cyclase / dehydrase and lipid transport
MKLSGEVVIEASADRVWEILGHRFADIGQWATAIDDSGPAVVQTEALPGRVCHTGMRAFPAVTEHIVADDEPDRTLTYEATGLPAFIGEARNTWQVSPIGQDRARARFDGVLATRGLAGRAIALPLRIRMRRETRLALTDLKHYAEHGTPSTRKRRRTAARHATYRAGGAPT